MNKINKKRKNKSAMDKEENKKKYKYVFINGKQVKIQKAPTIDGIPIDEFIEQNADPIWLHNNEMWEHIKS